MTKKCTNKNIFLCHEKEFKLGVLTKNLVILKR